MRGFIVECDVCEVRFVGGIVGPRSRRALYADAQESGWYLPKGRLAARCPEHAKAAPRAESPTRVAVKSVLREATGPVNTRTIARRLNLSTDTIKDHLKVIKAQGLATSSYEGWTWISD